MSGATLRCRVCSARNPRDAAWCTQCYTPFAPEVPIDDVNAGDADGSSTTTAAAVDPDLRDQTAPLFTDPEHDRTEPLFSRSDHDQTLPVSDHDQTEPLFPSPERAPTRAPGRPSEPTVV